MVERALEGLRIGVTADRRAAEQAQMLEQRGARVVLGPALRTTTIDDEEPARAATFSLLRHPPDVVVANTALGVRAWLSMADAWGRANALQAVLAPAYVVARGPKAAGALLAAGVDVHWRAPSAVLAEVVEHLLDLGVDGQRVVLLGDGAAPEASDEPARTLRAAGADVVELTTYRWTVPVDPAPALRLVDAACGGRGRERHRVDAPAVHNLLDLAGEAGRHDELVEALNGPVLAMCIGPVCRGAATARGVAAAVPDTARLGGMVKTLADELGGRRRTVRVGAVEALVLGAVVRGSGTVVSLAARERAVFDVLTQRPEVVVPRRVLLEKVWGAAEADGHALEATVGRLRRRLSPTGLTIEAVMRRGYRLAARDGSHR